MANINYIQTNFTSGELSPQIEGRVDLSKYANGAATLNNVFVRAYGGAYRRPGTYYANSSKESTNAVRLIPFEYSADQAYIVEMGATYFRYFKDNGILLSGSTPVSITHNYTQAQLFDVAYAQDADTMYIVHKTHHPMKMTRSSHYLWSIEKVPFRGGPWEPDNTDSTHTMTAAANSGNTTFTSNKAYFKAGHSGSFIRLGANNGHALIKEVSSSTVALVTVQGTVSTTSATDNWAMGAWNLNNGYPSSVTFFEQRLYFGGSINEPQTLWGSVSLDYENFAPGSDDADAVSFTIASNQANVIRWLGAGGNLIVGTAGGNFVLHSDTSSGPVTGTNINVKRETGYGSKLLMPAQVADSIVYCQRNERTIRELKYDFEADAQKAEDLTLLSEHISQSGVVDMAFQESPESILWCCKSDGTMATMTRLRDQEVLAWTVQETLGSFTSVACIPNGEEDQVWVVVQRSLAAGSIYCIEYFKPFYQSSVLSSAFYVDCGLSYDNQNTKASTVTGLDHLNSRNVSILGDGAVYPDQMVTAGSITISRTCNVIHAGLPYTSTIRTMRLEGGQTTQGLIKRIYKIIVRLWRTLGCQIGDGDTMDTVYFRDSTMSMGVTYLFTGDKIKEFPVGWNREAQVTITQSQPLPLNVLAIVSKAEISEG